MKKIIVILLFACTRMYAVLDFFQQLCTDEATQVGSIITQHFREQDPSSCPSIRIAKYIPPYYTFYYNGQQGAYDPFTKLLILKDEFAYLDEIDGRLRVFIQQQKQQQKLEEARSYALTKAASKYFQGWPKLFDRIWLREPSEDGDGTVAMTVQFRYQDGHTTKCDICYPYTLTK